MVSIFFEQGTNQSLGVGNIYTLRMWTHAHYINKLPSHYWFQQLQN